MPRRATPPPGVLPAVLIAFSLLVGGCASPKKLGEFRYGLDTAPGARQVFFPPPPDVPRYWYSGELVGERNFFPELLEKTFAQKLFDVLTGITDNSVRELELLRPQAVATDSRGRIFATDVGHAAVFVFDQPGGEARLLRRAAPLRAFTTPTGITIGPGDQLLVADSAAALVARLDADGNPLSPIGEGQLKRPVGVAFDRRDGRVFVADSETSQIKVFDLEGKLLSTWGSPGDQLGEFNRPTHLALWKRELYVTDTLNARVQVIDIDSGKPIRSIGTRGTYVGQMAIPKGVAVDSEGNTYVIESLFDHLLVFNRAGRLLMAIGGTGYSNGTFYLPAGLWVDERDRLYIADMFNGRIVSYLYLGDPAETDE